jgi:hypothetical protein
MFFGVGTPVILMITMKLFGKKVEQACSLCIYGYA